MITISNIKFKESHSNNRIEIIKAIKKHFGCGLLDAKKYFESLLNTTKEIKMHEHDFNLWQKYFDFDSDKPEEIDYNAIWIDNKRYSGEEFEILSEKAHEWKKTLSEEELIYIKVFQSSMIARG